MSSKEKLSLRVETLEQPLTELSLQNKSLKQQIEKVKLENLGNVKNDLWFKYRSEVHKIFGRIYDVISKYHKIFWLMIVSFIISIFIINYTSYINKIPFLVIIILIFFFGCFTYIFPLIFVLFQLKIYLQLKNPKNFILILKPTIKFLYKSLTTFVFISGFPLTLYLFMRIYIYVLGNKIDNVSPELLKYSLDSIMQGKDLIIITYIMVIGITLLTFIPYHVQLKVIYNLQMLNGNIIKLLL